MHVVYMQSMWTFSEENNQKAEYTINDVNLAKVKSALSSSFLRRDKELGLAAGISEFLFLFVFITSSPHFLSFSLF